MDYLTFEITNSGILKFLFLGTILFIAQILIGKLIHLLPSKNKINLITKQFFPFIEILVWGIFLIWSASTLFNHNIVYTATILLFFLFALILFSWFLAKDIIAGIILKTENSFKIGDTLKFEKYSGKIIRTNYRYLEIETDKGISIRTPYSKIADNPIIKLNPTETMINNQSIILTASKHNSETETINKIKVLLLNSPFVSITKKPNIKKSSETKDKFVFDITLSTLDAKYIPTIKSYLEKQLGNK